MASVWLDSRITTLYTMTPGNLTQSFHLGMDEGGSTDKSRMATPERELRFRNLTIISCESMRSWHSRHLLVQQQSSRFRTDETKTGRILEFVLRVQLPVWTHFELNVPKTRLESKSRLRRK